MNILHKMLATEDNDLTNCTVTTQYIYHSTWVLVDDVRGRQTDGNFSWYIVGKVPLDRHILFFCFLEEKGVEEEYG